MAKNPAAVSLGRLGGLARAATMTKKERALAASLAGKAGGWPKGKKRGPRKKR